MAIADAKKRRIGQQLVDWIYLGIRTGARRSVADYRISGNLGDLTRAVNMPRRARARINKWIADYDAAHGSGTGLVYLKECLSLAGTVTYDDLDAELTRLEDFAADLIAQNKAGKTPDEIATAIETQVEWEAKDWVFPIPDDYTDIPIT